MKGHLNPTLPPPAAVPVCFDNCRVPYFLLSSGFGAQSITQAVRYPQSVEKLPRRLSEGDRGGKPSEATQAMDAGGTLHPAGLPEVRRGALLHARSGSGVQFTAGTDPRAGAGHRPHHLDRR